MLLQSRRSISGMKLVTMASQKDMFCEEDESQDVIDVGDGGEEEDEDGGDTVEGVVVQERVPNDYDAKTKKTVAWQEGELSIIIDHMDDHYDYLVGHTKGNEYRHTRVNAWKRLLRKINHWNDVNGTNLVRSVKSIRTKIRNLRQRSEYCSDVTELLLI